MAADTRGPHLRLAGSNRGAIDAGAADFQKDAVGDVFIEQRAGYTGGRPREQR